MGVLQPTPAPGVMEPWKVMEPKQKLWNIQKETEALGATSHSGHKACRSDHHSPSATPDRSGAKI